jgi:hypothetical protein
MGRLRKNAESGDGFAFEIATKRGNVLWHIAASDERPKPAERNRRSTKAKAEALVSPETQLTRSPLIGAWPSEPLKKNGRGAVDSEAASDL